MNLKKILLVAGLALSAGTSACAAVALMPNDSKPAIEAKAASGDAWYIYGSMNSWTQDDNYKILEGTTPKTLFLDAGFEFRVAKAEWADEKTSATGTAVSNGITFSNGSGNCVVNTTGLYTFSVSTSGSSGNLNVDVVEKDFWVYHGSDTDKTGAASSADWAGSTSHYLFDGGDPVTFTVLLRLLSPEAKETILIAPMPAITRSN